METTLQRTAHALRESRDGILRDWIKALAADARLNEERVRTAQLERDAEMFLDAFLALIAGEKENWEDATVPEFAAMRSVLTEMARRRLQQGFSSTETVVVILSLKEWLAPCLVQFYRTEPDTMLEEIQRMSKVVDALGCVLIERFIEEREEVISRQSREILEISTPVVEVWDGILIAPLIGTLDSARTQQFMEILLDRIVETNSPIALIDITGVPTIDTQTARHLVETIKAVRLLGCEVIVTGVRKAIAQTLVHLGVDIPDVKTRSSLSAGLQIALRMLNLHVVGAGRHLPATPEFQGN